jgi:MinD-like ATPase involved in chromosome partitioning or flagellar assembly
MSSVELRQRGRRRHLAVVGEPDVPPEPVNPYPVHVIACWGPAGSPGKSTLATNIASELALSGQRVLLIDLDTLAPSIALSLGLVDTPAGLSACLRLVEQQRFTKDEYERLTVSITLGRHELRFMPGLISPHRWPEVTPERLEKLFASLVGMVDHVVLDLPQATEFKSQVIHPSTLANDDSFTRDSLLRNVLTKASKLVLVSGCDAVSAQRFLISAEYLENLNRTAQVYVVVNRYRTSTLGSNAKDELEQTYQNLAKLRIDCFIPEDSQNIDKAMLNGLPLALLKRSSPARLAIGQLVKQLQVGSTTRASVAKLS